MIAISYHDSIKVLQEAKLVSASPFDRPEWFRNLSERTENNALFCLANDGSTLATLAFRQSPGRLDALTNWYAFTWRPLHTGTIEMQPLLAALARDVKSRASRIVLAPLPDEEGTATALENAFRKAGWFVSRDQCDVNHVLPVKGRSYSDYLASRPGPLRTTLARKAKKVSIEIF